MIDHIHQARKTSAWVKRELRQVREIVGTDEDAVAQMQVALRHARHRVVLKWPAKAAPLPGIQTYSHQILGNSPRYDVFMCYAGGESPAV